jgi:hypothetical protein
MKRMKYCVVSAAHIAQSIPSSSPSAGFWSDSDSDSRSEIDSCWDSDVGEV